MMPDDVLPKMDLNYSEPLESRLVVWGLSFPENAEIVRKLSRQQGVSLQAWFGIHDGCTHDIRDFFRFQTDYDYKSAAVTETLYQTIYGDLAKFVDMFNRHNRDEKRRPLLKYDYYDYIQVFNRFVYFFTDLLVKQKVNIVLFASIPHEGPDFILYRLARHLGIQTVILYQSLFPNRYMTMTEIDDFGLYGQQPKTPLNEPVRLEKREALYYMKALKRPCFEKKDLWKVIKQDFLKKIQRGDYATLLERSRYFIKYLDYQQYKKNTAEITDALFSLNRPYVYFPLHYQPEMTTSGLGGVYTDQALALERLSKLIPEDWLIYAKDHVIQTEFMRGDWFFQRLKHIHNLRFVPVETNTFELIENAQFVATITGTAGWEALKNGKKALIFGRAWYQHLPGVFQYRENFDWQNFMDSVVDVGLLEKAVNELVAEMDIGVIETTAIPLVSDYNNETNARIVSENLLNRFHSLLTQHSATPSLLRA